MRVKEYIAYAAILILIIYLAYFSWFYFILDYGLSGNPEVWGQFGDYIGGILNPLLSFVSIALLIKSLILQHEANSDLKVQLGNNERLEKLKSFELLFFNLISSQKNLFDLLEISFKATDGTVQSLCGVKAVLKIEDEIENISGGDFKSREESIMDYLNNIDADDKIFGLVRGFYISVVMVMDRLSDANGFSVDDRRAHFKVLINLTDFSLIRLIMISVQFLDYESTKYLRNADEFKFVAHELGLKFDMY